MADSVSCYRYKINANINIKNDKGELVRSIKPFQYISLTIENNYFESFLPIVKLSCKVDIQTCRLLTRYERYITCSLSITEESCPSEEFNVVQSKKILDDMFVVYFDKSKLPRLYETSSKIVKSEPGSEVLTSDEYSMALLDNYSIDLIMWQLDALKAKKVFYNAILSTMDENISVADVMVYIGNKNKYISEFLFDTPDNTVRYKQIILLPYNLPLTIKSLQFRYGMFSRGVVSFFDNGRLYLLKKYDTVHSTAKDQLQKVIINLTENEPTITQPTNVSRDKYSEKYSRNFIIKTNENRPAMSEIFGDSILFSNFSKVVTTAQYKEDELVFNSPINEIKSSDLSHNESGYKISSEYDELNNPFIMNEYVKDSEQFPVNIAINATRIGSFDPYKTVTLKTNNSQSNDRFGGDYQVGSVIYKILFETNGEINNMGDCSSVVGLISPTLKEDGFKETPTTYISE